MGGTCGGGDGGGGRCGDSVVLNARDSTRPPPPNVECGFCQRLCVMMRNALWMANNL